MKKTAVVSRPETVEEARAWAAMEITRLQNQVRELTDVVLRSAALLYRDSVDPDIRELRRDCQHLGAGKTVSSQEYIQVVEQWDRLTSLMSAGGDYLGNIGAKHQQKALESQSRCSQNLGGPTGQPVKGRVHELSENADGLEHLVITIGDDLKDYLRLETLLCSEDTKKLLTTARWTGDELSLIVCGGYGGFGPYSVMTDIEWETQLNWGRELLVRH